MKIDFSKFRTDSSAAAVAVLFFGLLVWVGCGPRQISQRQIEQSEGAYDRGLEAFVQSDYREAVIALTRAIEGGGLQPDLYVDAQTMRARARAALGELEAALAELDELAEDAPNLDAVHAARGYVLLEAGDRTAARQAFQEARRHNASIVMPRELQ